MSQAYVFSGVQSTCGFFQRKMRHYDLPDTVSNHQLAVGVRLRYRGLHSWRFHYIYYNNKFHNEGGTRGEYRIKHMTKFLRSVGAIEGDVMVLSGSPGSLRYLISVRKADQDQVPQSDRSVRTRLKDWRRVY